MTRFYQTFAFLVLFACQQPQPPNDVLALDQMAKLVEEITIIETHFQSRFGVPSQYKKALDQNETDFTALTSPYEEPENPDLMIDVSVNNAKQAAQILIEFLQKKYSIKLTMEN